MQPIIDAARQYHKVGFCVLPLRGKVPQVRWKVYQSRRPTRAEIDQWAARGLFQNVGIVCGVVSGGLVVIDCDGEAASHSVTRRFPALAETRTVRTGRGLHLYLFADVLPRSRGYPLAGGGRVDVRAAGTQVVAPPSLHPSGRRYTLLRADPIRRVRNLHGLVRFMDSQARSHPKLRRSTQPQPLRNGAHPDMVRHISERLRAWGYKPNGDWLNGPCLYPAHHRHADRHLSFGFNTRTGYGYCWVCGSMLAKELEGQLCRSSTVYKRS